MPPKILLVNGWKSGVPARLRACEPEAEIHVITEPACASMYDPADTPLYLVDDIADLTAVRTHALALNKGRPFDHVVAPAERSLPAGGYLRTLFGLPGIGFETANRFSNKAAMKRTLSAAGLPTAPFRTVSDLDEVPAAASALGWPVIVKPAIGGGSQNTHVLRSAADVARLADSAAGEPLKRLNCQLMVEAFLTLTGEYHCEGVVEDGVIGFTSVGRYHRPLFDSVDQLTGSVALPDHDPTAKQIRELHELAVVLLGLRSGVTHLEVLRTADGLVIGEITCRPPASITKLVELQHGVDLWSAFAQTALGKPVTLPEPPADSTSTVAVTCELPAKPGMVRRIPTADAWADLPEVVETTMAYRPGDVIGTRLHSSSYAGLVCLRANGLDDVPRLLAEVASRYFLDVEPNA
ncbi:ATP-grasp domain-containing protein [Amycolatopsis sp. NPDC059657]|uniref:ATP-grasp domain-containing protein n=1 Tax=Amycolatopsis sp. NPDC059657 TaxID=3346899 RepID=UPI00366AA9B5